MSEKIQKSIESNTILDNLKVEYENFNSEYLGNLKIQESMMGKPVEYGNSFQLFQENSKRYLCLSHANSKIVKDKFKQNYTDNSCYQICFSEYPNSTTHFYFEECCEFQKRSHKGIKDKHLVYLAAKFDETPVYAYNVGDYTFMTETLKCPLTAKVMNQSDQFAQDKNVKNKELVIITSANEKLYLNVHVTRPWFMHAEGKAVFHPWSDNKDIDINAWFIIEYDEEDDESVYLKHFSTDCYLIVKNKQGISDDILLWKENKEQQETKKFAKLKLKTIDSEHRDVLEFDSDTIFKIKSVPGEDIDSRSYLRVANEDDKRELLHQDIDGGLEAITEVLDLDIQDATVPVVVKEKCRINYYDTFHLEFPHYSTYRDLVFWKDIDNQITTLGGIIMSRKDVGECVKEHVMIIGNLYVQIHGFINNKLKGRIHSDYLVGEIVPHRQKMFHHIGLSFNQHCFYEFLMSRTKLAEVKSTNMKEKYEYEKTMTADQKRDWEKQWLEIDKFPTKLYGKYEHLMELIFETILCFTDGSPDNIQVALKFVDALTQFPFVEQANKLLVLALKGKYIDKEGSHEDTSQRSKLYSRIFDCDEVFRVVDYYIHDLKLLKDFRYLKVLKNLCVIDNNPLPLIQNRVFKELYDREEEEKANAEKGINSSQNDNCLVVESHYPDEKPLIINGEDKIEGLALNYLINQLALESNLCKGGNEVCKEYFKNKYPIKNLTNWIRNEEVSIIVRAQLIKLVTYIHIDKKRSTQKITKWFKSRATGELWQSDQIDNDQDRKKSKFENLIMFYCESFEKFNEKELENEEILGYHRELIRSINYLLHYGEIRQEFKDEKNTYINKIFAYLCKVLKFFTKSEDAEKLYTLESIAQKEASGKKHDFDDPLSNSMNDLRTMLFNKRDWSKSTYSSDAQLMHTKIITEIIGIFNFLIDLRHQFVNQYIVDNFDTNIEEKKKQYKDSEELNDEIVKGFVGGFIGAITAIKEPTNATNRVRRLDQIYYDDYLLYQYDRTLYLKDKILTNDFEKMVMDIFNVGSRGYKLKRSVLNLLSRTISERSEFVRNLEKTLYVYNQQEYEIYQDASSSLERFSFLMDTASIWLKNEEPLYEGKSENYLDEILETLCRLHDSLYNKSKPQGEKSEVSNKGRSIDPFIQKVYVNLKAHDYIIDFLKANKGLLKAVREKTCKYEENSKDKDNDKPESDNAQTKVAAVFRACFDILIGMTFDNVQMKQILWKYKEFFAYSDLKSFVEDGELELLLVIIIDNPNVISERSFTLFISSLNSRLGNVQNFIFMLEIYRRIVAYETGDSLKSYLLEVVANRAENLDVSFHDNIEGILSSINGKELLLTLLFNFSQDAPQFTVNKDQKTLGYSIASFASHFPFDTLMTKIESAVQKLRDVKKTGKYAKIRKLNLLDRELYTLVNLYDQMYFEENSNHHDYQQATYYLGSVIMPALVEKINFVKNFIEGKDKNGWELQDCKKSENFTGLANFLVVLNLDKIVNRIRSKSFEYSQLSALSKFEEYNAIHIRLSKNGGYDKLIRERLHFQPRSIEQDEDKSSKFNISFRDSRCEESKKTQKIWNEWVEQIMKTDVVTKEIKYFQRHLAKLMYDVLRRSDEDKEYKNTITTLKAFITNLIRYICMCPKESKTIYIVTYMFRVLSYLVRFCEEDLRDEKLDPKVKMNITSHVLDHLDTMDNVKLIFEMINQDMNKSFYNHQVFMIASYFINRLTLLRHESIQMKFQTLFRYNSGSESFFSKIYKYLEMYEGKIKNGSLEQEYWETFLCDEAAKKPYYIDKWLERQAVILIKLLCSRGNKFMQDYIRVQSQNSKNFDLVTKIRNFAQTLTDHLHHKIVYDVFLSCLECLFEMIQGPNRENSHNLVMNGFVEFANDILELDYYDDKDIEETNKDIEETNKQQDSRERNHENQEEVKNEDQYNNVDQIDSGRIDTTESTEMESTATTIAKNKLKAYLRLIYGDDERENNLFGVQVIDHKLLTKPLNNYMISLAKFHVLQILNHLLDGYKPMDYIFYLYRREISPDVFRKCFAQQRYFFIRYYK